MTKNRIGENIRIFRTKHALTQKDLADRIGVSPQAVFKWETGICCPDILLLPDLSAIMGITIDQLFRTKETGSRR